MLRCLPLLAMALLPGISLAAEEPAVAAIGASSGSLVGQLLQLALGLAVVIGLIFTLGYLMRRVGPLAPQGGQPVADLATAAAGNGDFGRKLQALLKRGADS